MAVRVARLRAIGSAFPRIGFWRKRKAKNSAMFEAIRRMGSPKSFESARAEVKADPKTVKRMLFSKDPRYREKAAWAIGRAALERLFGSVAKRLAYDRKGRPVERSTTARNWLVYSVTELANTEERKVQAERLLFSVLEKDPKGEPRVGAVKGLRTLGNKLIVYRLKEALEAEEARSNGGDWRVVRELTETIDALEETEYERYLAEKKPGPAPYPGQHP